MEIRDATIEDAEVACEVTRRSITDLCVADHKNNATVLALWLSNKTRDNFAAWIAHQGNSVLVAVEQGIIVGVGALSDVGEITLNYVSPDARFRGVSRALLAALENRAMQQGNSRCKLTSTETAHRFYLDSGYIDDGSSASKFSALGHPMSKLLGPMLGARRLTCAFMLAALLLPLFAAAPLAAQSWPTRPVKFILTLGPGSGADIGARLLADRLTRKWDQPIVVENRPGGDGIVAINAFVSAQDDHVLLFAPSSSFIGHPYQHNDLPYKPDDLAPIARVSNTVVAISVPADLPVKTLGDVVELARSKPGQLNWAGLTGGLDIIFEGWLKSIGVDVKKVPYRNPVEAANDLAAGRVQLYESAYAIARPQIQAGKIKALAVTNTARAAAIPDVPTVAEAGYAALTIDGLVGLFGPPTMPKDLRERIAADIRSVMEADPLINERLIMTAQVPNPGGPAEFAKSIDEQRAVLAKAAKELGITPK